MPGRGTKISHAVEQLSPRVAITEPRTVEPTCHDQRAGVKPQRLSPWARASLCTTGQVLCHLQGTPPSPTYEKEETVEARAGSREGPLSKPSWRNLYCILKTKGHHRRILNKQYRNPISIPERSFWQQCGEQIERGQKQRLGKLLEDRWSDLCGEWQWPKIAAHRMERMYEIQRKRELSRLTHWFLQGEKKETVSSVGVWIVRPAVCENKDYKLHFKKNNDTALNLRRKKKIKHRQKLRLP